MRYLFPALLALSFFTFMACRPEPVPPSWQKVLLHYSIEDGLWAPDSSGYFFILDDQCTFDRQQGLFTLRTPHTLDPAFFEWISCNCPNSAGVTAWEITKTADGLWQLQVQLPQSTVTCLNDKTLWDDSFWEMGFQLSVISGQ
jgi:hypothetical protein